MRDYKIVKPAVHRSAVAAADTGDQSAIGTYISTDNALHAAVMLETSNAGASVQIALALFDENNVLMGISDILTVTSDNSWIRGAGGKYICPVAMFDLAGANKYRVLVKSISAGTVDIYSIPLQIN